MNPKIAERISTRRKQLGMSQNALASEVGVTKQAISNYEKGIRTPDFEVLDYLSSALKTSLGYLIGATDDPAPPLPPDYEADQSNVSPSITRQELFDDPDRKALLSFARNGSPEAIRQVNALIDALKATNPDFYEGDDPA